MWCPFDFDKHRLHSTHVEAATYCYAEDIQILKHHQRKLVSVPKNKNMRGSLFKAMPGHILLSINSHPTETLSEKHKETSLNMCQLWHYGLQEFKGPSLHLSTRTQDAKKVLQAHLAEPTDCLSAPCRAPGWDPTPHASWLRASKTCGHMFTRSSCKHIANRLSVCRCKNIR
jgi:hypothetical protein